MVPLKQVFLAAVLVYQVSALANLEEVFAWKELSFVWPSDEFRANAIKSGDYVPENNLPLGIEKWKNKLFITVPRWKKGVAATLGYVPLDQPINKTAAVIPYPDLKSQILPKAGEKPGDGHITSIFRVTVDACDRLWVVDTGLADILGDPTVISQPAILIYDLNTDKLIRRYTFKDDDVKQDSFLANIIIDTNKNKCEDAYGYVPDLGGFGIVVYSLKENDSWRFKHNFFHFDPLQGDFNVGGVNFQWKDGVFGLALGPEDQNGYRTVYFHPLVSLNEFAVNSSILKNKTLANDPHIYYEFRLLGNKGEKSQTSSSIYDNPTDVLFLTQLSKDGVACWNTKKDLKPENVALVIHDPEKLIFTNDIRIDEDRYLWMISNKMPQYNYYGLNSNEVNYRIFKVKVDDAIAGTPCVA
ncbi:protein yellow [Euwallacea fornicatus]|uniref:protein yellow n=1 Tax=Euwallacea fornicatus TaxID=995702 RepID=UPI0033902729